jgi:hypothetical protein
VKLHEIKSLGGNYKCNKKQLEEYGLK